MTDKPTTDEIVNEVSQSFSRKLSAIMNDHDFQLNGQSGVWICQNCGRAETRKVMSSKCRGLKP